MNLEEIKSRLVAQQVDLYPEVRWLIAEVERLKPFEHEYICKKCGIRQNSNSEIPNF